MRRSWMTTEFLSALAGLTLFICMGLRAKIRMDVLAGVLSGLLVCVMINRALYKRDRAFFDDPAVMGSGEFICLLLNYALVLTAVYHFHLAVLIGILLMAGVQAAYILTRGWAKRNTIRHGRP